MDRTETRQGYLDKFAKTARAAIGAGMLGAPVALRAVETINGPRAGALEIHAGFQADDLFVQLTKGKSAVLAQMVPWKFSGHPAVYLPPGGRGIRIEVGWPDNLSDRDVRLADVGLPPHDGLSWTVGKNDTGQKIIARFGDTTPGYLVAGETGAGKSVAIQSLVYQLSGAAAADRKPANLVLIDGKFGEGIGPVASLPGVVGPLAADLESARRAVLWTHQEMTRRYSTGFARQGPEQKSSLGPLVLCIDEVEMFADDKLIVRALRNIVSKGRAVWCYTILCTHHPVVSILKDSAVKHGLVGRHGLRCTSYAASQAIFGASWPRADWLSGAGDSYVLTPQAWHRVQVAYATHSELRKGLGAQPRLDSWPYISPQAAGLDFGDNRTDRFSPEEVAVAMIAAKSGAGRPALQDALETLGLGRPGGGRGADLLMFGRQVLEFGKKIEWKLP